MHSNLGDTDKNTFKQLAFKEPGGTLLPLDKPVIGPYLEQIPFSSLHDNPLLSNPSWYYPSMCVWARRVIGISGSLIWSKILMELIFNPCGEFWWSPEGPVSQIHSSHLHSGAPGIFSDLLRSVQSLKREWVQKTMGSNCTCSYQVKLQPWFLSLRWKTVFGQNCSLGVWAEHSDDGMV